MPGFAKSEYVTRRSCIPAIPPYCGCDPDREGAIWEGGYERSSKGGQEQSDWLRKHVQDVVVRDRANIRGNVLTCIRYGGRTTVIAIVPGEKALTQEWAQRGLMRRREGESNAQVSGTL